MVCLVIDKHCPSYSQGTSGLTARTPLTGATGVCTDLLLIGSQRNSVWIVDGEGGRGGEMGDVR